MSGIGALGTEQGFMGGLQEGLMSPFQAAGNIFSSGAQNPLQQGIFGNASRGFNMDTFFPKYDPTGGGASYFGGAETPTTQINPEVRLAGEAAGINDPNILRSASERLQTNFPGSTEGGVSIDAKEALNQAFIGPSITTPASSTGSGNVLGGIGQKLQKFIGTPMGGNLASAATIGGITYLLSPEEELQEGQLSQLSNPQRAAYDQLRGMSTADRRTPAGIALLRQSGIQAFYTPEQLARIIGSTVKQTTKFQEAAFGEVGKGRPSVGTTQLAGIPNLMPPLSVTATAAAGGEISGPGTGRSDSIPALLSDGEFVMTAEAVRNAGNGDRDRGAAKMYDIMHGFEGRA